MSQIDRARGEGGGPVVAIECPGCGYDLRGEPAGWTRSCPLEGTCPECGEGVSWRDLLASPRTTAVFRARSQETSCAACGYSLRGIGSVRCPECGEPRRVVFRFASLRDFVTAREALGARGLVRRATEPGGAIGPIGVLYGTGPSMGEIEAPADREDEVVETLEAVGLPAPSSVRTIVDRAEPRCPECEGELDPAGDADACERCGVEFDWVDTHSDGAVGAEGAEDGLRAGMDGGAWEGAGEEAVDGAGVAGDWGRGKAAWAERALIVLVVVLMALAVMAMFSVLPH